MKLRNAGVTHCFLRNGGKNLLERVLPLLPGLLLGHQRVPQRTVPVAALVSERAAPSALDVADLDCERLGLAHDAGLHPGAIEALFGLAKGLTLIVSSHAGLLKLLSFSGIQKLRNMHI
jgi:hypothetical protein